MILKSLYVTLISILFAPLANAQLYLLSGAPTPNDGRAYATTLIQIASDGSVRPTAELFPQSAGTEWIGFSYDRRQAVIFSLEANSVIVLDLDAATVAKTCALPAVEGAYLMTQFMADVPGRGLTFEWFLKGPPSIGDHVLGMILNPAIPCDASLVTVAHSDVRLVAASGTAGVADIHCFEGVAAVVSHDGTLIPAVFADDETPWPEKVPLRFVSDLSKPLTPTSVVVSNGEMLVIHIATGEKEPLYLAFRKRDKTWHVLRARTDEWDRMRGFGRYVSMTVARPKTEGDRPTTNTFDMKTLLSMEAEQKISAGAKDWRTELQPEPSIRSHKSIHGPDMFDSFFNARYVYTGRLLLFDIETDKMYTIDTKQGDSEVLLVENDIVYYRVTDRIYSAPILADTIGAPKLVAEHELIQDAHYAFFKH